MKHIYTDTLGGTMILTDELHDNFMMSMTPTLYKFIWVKEGALRLVIDHMEKKLRKNELVSLTSLSQVEFKEVDGKYISILFNSPFYSIYKHSEKVSCNGLLFNGSSRFIHLHPDGQVLSLLQYVIDEMLSEYALEDDLKGEMLRLLLKRFIIICTRLLCCEYPGWAEEENGLDVIRQYYILVNHNFKEKRKVKEYADLLHRSPKTLSNLFAVYQLPSPLKIIHWRITTEAKHLILNSNESNKEIAVLLGFENVSTFSRFFKRMTGETLSGYRERIRLLNEPSVKK